MKEDYWNIAYRKLGLATTDSGEFAHDVGTFRLIDLSETVLDALVIKRLNLVDRILHARRPRLDRPFAELSREEGDWYAACHHKFASEIRETYFLRYSRFTHILRNIKSYNPARWQDMNGTYEEVRNAVIEGHFKFDLYEGGRYDQTIASWKNYLRKASPSFYDFLLRPVPARVPERQRAEHTYICGASGSGKSESCKIFCHSYIRTPDHSALVVIEPSGRLVQQIAGFKENVNSERLIYVTYERDLGLCPVINPFEISGIAPSDLSPRAIGIKRIVAQELRDALGEVIKADGDTPFTVNMKATIMPCILVLLDMEGATLRDLLRFMDDKENDALLAFARTRAHYEDTVKFFENKFKSSDKSSGIGVTKNALFMKLSTLFDSGVVAHLTCGKSTIDLERAVNEKKIILFNLSKGRMGASEGAAFGRLVTALLKGIALRRDEQDASALVPIHLIIDECQNYISPSIRVIMEEQRKFKLMLTLCQTEIGASMPPETEKAVLNSTNIKIAGSAQAEQRRKAAALFPVDEDDIKRLSRGEFLVRTGRSAEPFALRIHTHLLDNSNSMTDAQWQATLARQHRLYYRPLPGPRPRVSAPTTDEEDETAAAVWQIRASGKSEITPS